MLKALTQFRLDIFYLFYSNGAHEHRKRMLQRATACVGMQRHHDCDVPPCGTDDNNHTSSYWINGDCSGGGVNSLLIHELTEF